MRAINKIRRNLTNYWREESGQFALLSAVMGLPLLLGISIALDMENGNRYKKNLEASLDAAALAAVQPALLSDVERRAYAAEVFYNNYPQAKSEDLNLEIDASRERVSMVASMGVPSFFGGVVGRDSLPVKEKATAVLTRSDTICVLALDEYGQGAVEFKDDARFVAPTCSVQVNSTHPSALISSVLTPPTARNFCSSGGAIGSFYPRVKTNCSSIADPYKDLEIPPAATSCDQRYQVVVRRGNGRGAGRAFLESQLNQNAEGSSIIPDHATLSPGIYCRGLEISGANVNLNPGVYHVWGDLRFTQNAGVYGDGVTFILKGEDNRLLVDEGAQVWLKAPANGLTAGLVFWQKYLNMRDYIQGVVPTDPKRLIATSEINSGGGLHIVGTAYLPNHKLIVTSDNAVSSRSPATSFIAYQIEFSGKTNMQVAVDHVTAGLPPIKPFTDDGARLID